MLVKGFYFVITVLALLTLLVGELAHGIFLLLYGIFFYVFEIMNLLQKNEKGDAHKR